MARAEVYTQIPLDRVAQVLQLDPLHFNSVFSHRHPNRNACDDTWFQWDWQNTGKVSRESLALALKQAEDRVAEQLGYYLLPKYFQQESHLIEKYVGPDVFNSWLDTRGFPKSVNTSWAYVVETGSRAKTPIDTVAVVYSDPDGDGYDERATVTVVTDVTVAEELFLYYPGMSGEDAWQIRPITVSIAAGTATITYSKHQAPLASLLEIMPDPGEGTTPLIDGDDNANFLQEVDVYRVYTDPSVQGRVFTEDWFCYHCGGGGCTFCADTQATACLYIRDPRRGVLSYRLADWDEDTETFGASSYCGREPDRINLWYRAGYRNLDLTIPNYQMDPAWERMVIYYALTLIDAELCGCANFVEHADYMRTDLALATADKRYAVTMADLQNPLGTTLAAVQLWKRISAPGVRVSNR